MNQAERLKILQKTGKTVFSADFLRRVWRLSENNFKVTAKRMVDRGLLLRLGRGVYALTEDYDIFELAATLVSPSYLSFNSALSYHGVAFQINRTVESAANFSYQRTIGGHDYVYRKIRKSLLYDDDGLVTRGVLTLATAERAIADCFYLGIMPNIDNRDGFDPIRLRDIGRKYPVKVQKKIDSIL